MEVGLYPGGDDGEFIARQGLLRLFVLDPDYRYRVMVEIIDRPGSKAVRSTGLEIRIK